MKSNSLLKWISPSNNLKLISQFFSRTIIKCIYCSIISTKWLWHTSNWWLGVRLQYPQTLQSCTKPSKYRTNIICKHQQTMWYINKSKFMSFMNIHEWSMIASIQSLSQKMENFILLMFTLEHSSKTGLLMTWHLALRLPSTAMGLTTFKPLI